MTSPSLTHFASRLPTILTGALCATLVWGCSAGGLRDAGPDDLALEDAGDGVDAGGTPDESDAGSAANACESCAQRRCEAEAAACAGETACVDLERCRATCGSFECLEACAAGHTAEDVSAADRLSLCVSRCPIACAPGPITPRPEMCQPTFENCDDEVNGFGCCDAAASCVEPDGLCCHDGYCCAQGEQACGPDHPCCEGTCGADGRCVLPTCNAASCDSAPGLPCCDVRQTCGPVGVCCFPDGTEVSDSDAARCCSNAAENATNGTARCIAASN